MALYSIGFLLLICLINFSVNSDDGTEDRIQLIDEVIHSMENIIIFFKNLMDYVNVDGAIGIRISGGQLQAFLDAIKLRCTITERAKYLNLINRLGKLQKDIDTTGDRLIHYIKKNERENYKNIGFLIQKGGWYYFGTAKNTNRSLVYTSSLDNSDLLGPQSDKCIKEWETCQPSVSCWKYMTGPNHIGYFITHEIFYFFVAKFVFECNEQIEKMAEEYNGESSESLLNTWCANILVESNEIANKGFISEFQDLFMEQVTFCGLLGFTDFFPIDWIRKIISWQQPSGCYGPFTAPQNLSRRVRRNEQLMPGMCFSHKTMLALTSLQQAVRYLLEPILTSTCFGWKA